MPFDAESFDRIVCMAAFKNFSDPVGALHEMCRVLKSGRGSVHHHLRPDVTNAEIDVEVKKMRLGWVSSIMTKLTFKHMLRKRAYSRTTGEHGCSDAFQDLRDPPRNARVLCIAGQISSLVLSKVRIYRPVRNSAARTRTVREGA